MTTGHDTTPARQILPPERIDHVAEAVLALTREVWVLADRQIMLETLLCRHGIDIAEIDRLQPDETTQMRLSKRRQALLDAVLSALNVD